ncbi:sulfate/molybdate ABC transporter ATP-binding protein [Roseateles terrae]|uniref:Sulfate transport system ATP-binding protein n=1 Tax=Roseateles terrae TaxID=431060 RepID=A0ABR6GXI3_9BURK|nr:sulfate ABC transporter ATP-binding protein [Roseateles terrae]MBB3196808.1 sulfate transport system ATP-binding protein [Roseateles terrae]OWQ84625.1 sulfate ABC transporter ATP-binding protein [Roseateles terrae]
MSIQVRNIHKSFGSFTALGDVSLDFPTGELTALLGPSGCGKTTLLRIIAGLETADRGQVLLDGRDASDTHVREREVGFVFQHYALFRHMTVFDNVAFGLRVKPRKQRPPESEIKRKVHELLQLVQLDWLADRYPPQLSGGQRQRIALARALAVEPRVLLLDEPFGALDAKVRKELRRWLRRLHDELHITSIFVTHDQEEALEVADRVVLMDHGRVEQVGAPVEVYEHPATPFVYGFLGAVNRFEGRSEGGTLRVGDQLLAQGLTSAAHDPQGQVQAYARPHELIIIPQTDAPGLPATVERVLSFGAAARVELRGPQGEHLEAELSREQAEALALSSGQQVRLQASRLSVFGLTQAA